MSINNNLYELGQQYEKKGEYYKAITEYYIKIINKEPSNLIVLNQIGICYFCLNNFKLASHYFNKILKYNKIIDVYTNISNCYVNMKEYKMAENILLEAYNEFIKTSSNSDTFKKIISQLGQLYYYFKNYNKSIDFYKKISKPNDYSTLYSLSFSYLGNKNFIEGFKLYENRLKNNDINSQTKLKERVDIPDIKFWNGVDKCNRLLIVYEQGIGDNIMYYRFIVSLSKLYPNMLISYFCRDVVANLFKEYDNVKIINNVILSDYDYMAYIMSLPYILKLDNITPNEENYIKINENKTLYWHNKLNHNKLKVGFVHNGLLSCFIEKFIPLEEFNILTDLDIDLICLCKKDNINPTDNHIDPVPKGHNNIKIYDIDKEVPFEDTIHILQNIDLLITIDTYIVHLAGVMNIPTWLLLGEYSEWRWSNSDTTSWYNSVELIRMKGEFKNILQIVKQKLIKWIASK